jgi:dinuclear metal center YbgI/SA1388 family protein
MHFQFPECIFFCFMTIADLTKYLEDWAPPGAAWEKDNVGLQIGSRGRKIKNIMLCLELDETVLKQAIQKKCNFIFTHHPLIFQSIKTLDFQNDFRAKLIEQLIKNDISVYSAHTNLDFTKDGVSFELAKTLRLKNIRFLDNEEANQFKIITFVPMNSLEKISKAVFGAGAGVIGDYDNCGFRLNGQGSFKGSNKTMPVVGKKNKFEVVEEIRFEFIVDSWKLKKVISALLKSHPYEEPAYDIYPLKNKNINYGYGAMGELDKPMSEKEFMSHVKKTLKLNSFRYCDGKSKTIKKVAVCGGSGSELIDLAISKNADAFITADIKYHPFQISLGKVLLIDAGHYETEIPVMNIVQKKLVKFLSSQKNIKILKYTGTTNPIKFYKQNKGV